MNPQKRRQIFERFRAANPNPTTELRYGTPYELLVAVVLSAQSTDKGVNKVTAKLFPIANTPQKMVRLGVDTLVLVDGGTDSLMRGDEEGLGTPHEDIASLAGTTRPTANIVLNELQDQGVVSLSRGRIVIRDLRKLAAQAGR